MYGTSNGKCATTMPPPLPSPSPSPFLQALRHAAPSLSRQLFPYQPCLQLSIKAIPSPRPLRGLLSRPKKRIGPLVGSIRRLSTIAASETSLPAAGKLNSASPFPESSSNAVAYWLLGSAASVFGIVVFGGLTRLTESGFGSIRSIPIEIIADGFHLG